MAGDTDTPPPTGRGEPRSPRPGRGGAQPPRDREGFVERLAGGASPLGVLLKISLLGLVLYQAIIFTGTLVDERAWIGLTAMWVATAAIVWLFARPGRTPLKFIVPGTLFLLVFQIYPVLYTGYVSVTNFGTGNVLDKQGATTQLLAQSTRVSAEAVRYTSTAFSDGEQVAVLLVHPDGELLFGTAEELRPLEDVADVTIEDDQVVAVEGFQRLSLVQAQEFAGPLQELRVPTEGGAIQLQSLTNAARAVSTRDYDEDRDVLIDLTTGTEFTPVQGNFVSDEGEVLRPGWVAVTGMGNYTRAFTSPLIRGPFLRVFVWNYAFALGSVFLTFALGLALALALNESRMTSQRYYRSLLV
ncbi:MAG TPA: hypothetical protein VMM13_09755, partial [Euzebya sp.]|nr:hypothetical protein [Euzebya sp.]